MRHRLKRISILTTRQLWKVGLLVNNFWGKQITNNKKHRTSKLVLNQKVDRYMNVLGSSGKRSGDIEYEVCTDKRTYP